MNEYMYNIVVLEAGLTTNPFKGFMQVAYILVLFLAIIFGAFYTTRLVGKQQANRMRNSNLKIVDSISVGPQKSILLMQIGDSYVLIGVSKDHIQLIKDISAEHLDMDILNSGKTVPMISFGKVLQKLQNKKDNGKHDE